MIRKEKQGEPEAKAPRIFGTFAHGPNKEDAEEADALNEGRNHTPGSRPHEGNKSRKPEPAPGLEF